MQGRVKRYARWIKIQLRRAIRQNSSPAQTGLGFALGCFIGIFPSFLMGTPLAFFLAGLLGWNRAAAALATQRTNPVTAPVFYSVSVWLGMKVLGVDIEQIEISNWLSYIRHFGMPFLLGNVLVASALAAAFGWATFLLARSIQRRKQAAQLPARAQPL